LCKRDVKVSYNIFQYYLHVQGYERQKILPTILYTIFIQLLSERIACIEWFGQKTTSIILTRRKQPALSACLTTGWKCLMLIVYMANMTAR